MAHRRSISKREIKRVKVGVSGQTPRKGTGFDSSEPPIKVERASPHHAGSVAPAVLYDEPKQIEAHSRRQEHRERIVESKKIAATAAMEAHSAALEGKVNEKKEGLAEVDIAERPRTSRRVQNPSPDMFADYVVPSPRPQTSVALGEQPSEKSPQVLKNDSEKLSTTTTSTEGDSRSEERLTAHASDVETVEGSATSQETQSEYRSTNQRKVSRAEVAQIGRRILAHALIEFST